MKTTPRVSGDRSIMSIRYTRKSWKFLGFTATEGAGSTDPGYPYLSHWIETYSSISICSVVFPHVIGAYLNICKEIENHIKMRKYDIALEKYWVTQSGYFRLMTIVFLVTGITDVRLLLYQGISEEIRYIKIIMI